MVTVTRLPSANPSATPGTPAHHVNTPPTSFINPWPSFSDASLGSVFKTRFARDRPAFVPIPDRSELVPVHKPDFSANNNPGFKVTWLGHASFLLETSTRPGTGARRGVRVLCDPVFSERTSPFSFVGPKRYTPTPCSLEELPDIDVVVTSHNHYDHCDLATIKFLHHRHGKKVHFIAGLNNASWFHSLGIPESQVTELDWWDGVDVDVADVGSVRITCTPTQHVSGRGPLDRNKTLWCSYVVEELADKGGASARESPTPSQQQRDQQLNAPASTPTPRKIFFAGDTGYRTIPSNNLSKEEEDACPHNPEFARIGSRFGPFDLAALPIGLCKPRSFMSPMHCNPSDSLCLHKELKSRRSVGMHWGTVRGGLSQEYEDVRWPPREWKRVTQEGGLRWRDREKEGEGEWEAGLMDVGETIVV